MGREVREDAERAGESGSIERPVYYLDIATVTAEIICQ
jgi:hypothetical protein